MSAPATAFMVAWMEANKPRMWELMMARAPAPEAAFAEVFDGVMQAHLLLAGEALSARLGGEAEERLHAARTEIADRLADPETLARERALVLDAALREARLQHGEGAGGDPQIRDRCERRAAMMAPMRRLTLVLDEQLAPLGIALAPATFDWIHANGRRLRRLGLRAREIHMEQGGMGRKTAIDAASLQAHVRFLVEAWGGALGDEPID